MSLFGLVCVWSPISGEYLDMPSGWGVLGVLIGFVGVAIVLTDEELAVGGALLMLCGILLAIPLFVRGILRLVAAVGKRGSLGVALILIGVGFLVHGILDLSGGGRFGASHWGWPDAARLEAALGAVLVVGGSLLRACPMKP